MLLCTETLSKIIYTSENISYNNALLTHRIKGNIFNFMNVFSLKKNNQHMYIHIHTHTYSYALKCLCVQMFNGAPLSSRTGYIKQEAYLISWIFSPFQKKYHASVMVSSLLQRKNSNIINETSLHLPPLTMEKQNQ